MSKPGWTDPDDAPELTDEWFDKVGDKIVRRGRPKGSAKSQVALRLDKEAIERFRAGGPGWQSRMNEALREAVGL
jgi:uncharacterized protein (DUF4415 family)